MSGAGREAAAEHPSPVVDLRGLTVRRGDRTLWSHLDLQVAPGEFVAVLGPNGAGKSTLLGTLLGQVTPASGEVRVAGGAPGRRGARIGYVPQQRAFDPGLAMRGRDLVGLGLDGHRWGPGTTWLPGADSRRRRGRILEALEAVEAGRLAEKAVGRMSGGEQQRTRVAQALVGEPEVLLCDEPLLSLDLAGQRTVATALDRRRRENGTAVVFVTHEINPVLPLVDRVVYIVDGKVAIGTPDEVLTTETLSGLFGIPVDVLRVRGQIVVVGDNRHLGDAHHLDDAHHPDHAHHPDQSATDRGGL